MANIIKSVRVRPRQPNEFESAGSGDIKVTLLDDGLFGNKRTIQSDVFSTISYDKSSRYSNFSDDQFIDDYLSVNSKLANKSNVKKFNWELGKDEEFSYYEIIQDPWLDKVPKIRKFGFYPYYINNNCSIYIEWFSKESTVIGGSEYSDEDGNELGVSELKLKGIKLPDIKKFFIVADKKTITLDKNGKFQIGKDSIEYPGYTLDKDIIDQIIAKWQIAIPEYDLALCSPDNESCSLIEFKDPTLPVNGVSPDVGPDKENILNPQKIKLTIQGLEDGFQIGAKQDLPNFSIYIGEIPIPVEYIDDYENLDELDDEYLEGEFSGEEEIEVEIVSSDTTQAAIELESEPYIQGNHELDLIPGEYVSNSGSKIKVCQINGKLVNIKIAGPLLDMFDAAKKAGFKLSVSSGFRSPYDTIKTKSSKGVSVSSSSQKSLYDKSKSGKGNLAAEPGKSNHGAGIGVDLNTGSRKAQSNGPLNDRLYIWLVKNSWKFGFVRAVSSEEWHFDYLPNKINTENGMKNAYVGVRGGGTDGNRFYSDLGLDNLG